MANGHGGARAGSGRKRRPSFQDDGELLPLALMLSVVRDTEAPMSLRLAEAHQAAQYCHPRLQATALEVEGADLIINLVSYSDARAEPAKSDAEGLPAASVAGNGAGGA